MLASARKIKRSIPQNVKNMILASTGEGRVGYVRLYHGKRGVGGGIKEKGKFFVSKDFETAEILGAASYIDLPIEEAKKVLEPDLEATHFIDKPKANGWVSFNEGGSATLPEKYFSQLKPVANMQMRRTLDQHGFEKVSDFYTQATKVITPTIPKELEPLKYKSAEEFIEGQGDVVYHGSAGEIEGEFRQPVKGEYGSEAIFVSPSKKGAEYYVRDLSKGKITEVFINKDAKIWDFQNPKDVKIIEDFVNKNGVKSVDPEWILSEEEWINRLKKGDYTIIQRPEVIDIIRENDYDGFKQIDWYDFGQNVSIGIFEPKNIKTKQQLTDIWNKAQATKGVVKPTPTIPKELEGLAKEAKSAEEFVNAQGEDRSFVSSRE